MLTQDFEQDIHRRLLEHDPVASTELVEACIGPMVRRLYSLFPKLDDPHWVHDAVVDALLNYVQHPEKYSPVRGKLSAYLFMSARGDLLNRLEREGRRRKKEIPLEDVELHPIMRNILVEEENTGDQIPYGMSISGLTEALNQVIKDQVDKELLDLIIDGERKTECYSKILGISHLPIDEQRKQVKRAKDRLTKRLRRLGKSNEPR